MFDRHHILHYRQEWTLRPNAERLRESPPLVPEIPREIHNEIHDKTPAVPILGHHALLHTARLYRPVRGDTLASVDNLLFAMESASRHQRAHPIERSLAELAIQAIDLQRPFIKEGLYRGNITVAVAS